MAGEGGAREQGTESKLRPRAGRSALLVICVLAAAAMGAAAALGRTAVEPITETVSAGQSPVGLHGVDGPGFTITFTYSDNNQTVNFLNPGTYRITIDDLSNIHDFHLTGAGTDVATDVAAVGTTVWNVTLQPGTYTFVCDPHASTMNGQLLVLPFGTVTSFPAPPPQPKHHKKKR